MVMKQPRSRSGYVYLLAAPGQPGLYKIGRSIDPENRMKTFTVRLPFPVQYDHIIKTNDMIDLEYVLHKTYKKQRVNGEWFNLNAADVEYIKSLQDWQTPFKQRNMAGLISEASEYDE